MCDVLVNRETIKTSAWRYKTPVKIMTMMMTTTTLMMKMMVVSDGDDGDDIDDKKCLW